MRINVVVLFQSCSRYKTLDTQRSHCAPSQSPSLSLSHTHTQSHFPLLSDLVLGSDSNSIGQFLFTKTTRELKTQTVTKASTASLSLYFSMASSASSASSQSADEYEGFDLLKCSTVQEGKKEAEVKLPLGFRFNPTEDEIVVYFLFNKIMDRAMPTYDLIKEVDVYEFDPNQLPNGDFKHDPGCNAAYYFANREPFDANEGKIIKTAANGGYWKVIDDEEEVLFKDSDVTVGFETVMKFYEGQAPNGSKTPFIMHEYRLNPPVVPAHVLNDGIRNKIERYVVCRIINKEVSNQPIIEYGQGLLQLLQKSSAGAVEDGGPK